MRLDDPPAANAAYRMIGQPEITKLFKFLHDQYGEFDEFGHMAPDFWLGILPGYLQRTEQLRNGCKRLLTAKRDNVPGYQKEPSVYSFVSLCLRRGSKDERQLTAPDLNQRDVASCKYCGHPIRFVRTKNRRWLPCDASSVEAGDENYDQNKHKNHHRTCSAKR